MIENWVPVIDFDGFYEISDLGRVKSIERYVTMKNGFTKKIPERILKQGLNGAGYYFVNLYKNNIYTIARVHRLVWESFNGKTGLNVDHKVEKNQTDNRLCNLQAITKRENTSKYRLTTKKTSIYTGVYFSKSAKKWSSCIRIDGKKKHLGTFTDEFSAHLAYQSKLSELLRR
jgi:hypothetical protein